MPAHIIIRDGSPYWWASTDIWVVPGADPNAAPGTPVAGQPAYIWAHAVNSGNSTANGTRIDFYWADPSAQVVVGSATAVGSAFVDLDTDPAGQDVLCLVPWMPVVVNGGHECLLAVAHGPNDSSPIPDPLPNGYVFDPPAHDQIAQRNITVLLASMLASNTVISVRALPRQDKEAVLTVEFGGDLDERQLALLGLQKMQLRQAPRRAVQVELSLEPLCGGRHGWGHGGGHGQHGGGDTQQQGGGYPAGSEQVLQVSVAKTYAAGSEVGGDETLAKEPGVVEDDLGAVGGPADQGSLGGEGGGSDNSGGGSGSGEGGSGSGEGGSGSGEGGSGSGSGSGEGGSGSGAMGSAIGSGAAGTGAIDSGALEGADYSGRGRHGQQVRLHVRRGTAAAVYAAFSNDGLEPGQYQLVHVVERNQGKVVGGVSYVVVRPHEGDRK
ncbi:hypothetical protein LJR289_005702 [Pseudoduganella sp. LjRoot289]|uniref:hypothetical protein n=1 Tax=Pseudoduganella sp. LjRoot289 TaxID=3342314 RepID=UPI003ED131C6